jgi:hypothetical protein
MYRYRVCQCGAVFKVLLPGANAVHYSPNWEWTSTHRGEGLNRLRRGSRCREGWLHGLPHGGASFGSSSYGRKKAADSNWGKLPTAQFSMRLLSRQVQSSPEANYGSCEIGGLTRSRDQVTRFHLLQHVLQYVRHVFPLPYRQFCHETSILRERTF